MSVETHPTEETRSSQAELSAEAMENHKSNSLIAEASTEGTEDQFTEIKTQALSVLSDLFIYVAKFFSEYRKPLVNIGLILAALITLYLVAAIVEAINDIPLLASIFELIGIGYAGWFTFRYLLTAENRAELAGILGNFSNKVTGKDQ